MPSILITVAPALAGTLADTTLLVDSALAGMALLLLATFGLVWRLNNSMTRVEGALFDESFGVIVTLKELVAQVRVLESRVGVLERTD